MNERLKELYKQVCMEQKLPFTIEHNSAVMLDAFAASFAELIVEKCAGIIESQDVDPSFKLRMSWAVKQYFGVEQ